jgi:hypothetical protein
MRRKIMTDDIPEKPEKFWNDEEKEDDVQEKGLGKALSKDRALSEEQQELKEPPKAPQQKVNLEGEKIKNGLGQLILTVVELLRELLEKQAIRRIDSGSLSEEQVERLGQTFMNLKQEVTRLRNYFELSEEDLNFDLGPLTVREDDIGGKASAVEILDRLLGTGIVVRGDVLVSVAEVDLVSLNLGLLLASIDKARELYTSPDTEQMKEHIRVLQEENERLKKRVP